MTCHCRCKGGSRSLDRSQFKNQIRSRSKPEDNYCRNGLNVFGNVLGPTADETILVGLRTLIGLRNNMDDDVKQPINNSRNTVPSFKSKASSQHKEADSINKQPQEYVLANLELDNTDTSSQTDDLKAISQAGSQTSQHLLHNGSQTHKSTSDTSTDSPGPELEQDDIEHNCLLPKAYTPEDFLNSTKEYSSNGTKEYSSNGTKEYSSNGMKEYSSNGTKDSKNSSNEYSPNSTKEYAPNSTKTKHRKEKKSSHRKCICSTKNEYKAVCINSVCSLRKFKMNGSKKTPCSCRSDSTAAYNESESNKMQMGDSNDAEIKYAITKITKFCSYTTFEVMKSTRKKPRTLPNGIMGVFVLKNFQG